MQRNHISFSISVLFCQRTHVNLINLVKSFLTRIELQKMASIQPRTSHLIFIILAASRGLIFTERSSPPKFRFQGGVGCCCTRLCVPSSAPSLLSHRSANCWPCPSAGSAIIAMPLFRSLLRNSFGSLLLLAVARAIGAACVQASQVTEAAVL